MSENNYESIKICPVCGNHLEEIDDMNYITSICPHCYSTVFEELNGTLHVIKNGIAKDKYNVSMDIFYKQFLSHQMAIRGMLGNTNLGEIIALRMFKVNIYNENIFNHFYPMVKKFKIKSSYIYFDGYEKYLEMAKDYFKGVYPIFY